MTLTDSQTVWQFFHEICQIPRPSKQEERMIEYLSRFAAQHDLPVRVDAAGNVLITKPGTSPAIALQAHMDMVCEKTAESKHDFTQDPIETYLDDGWMRARGTTLGADDGVGVALALAALLSDTPRAVEALFTVDEETGLTGAEAVEPGWLQASELINLDSEEDDELIIGCAGGCETSARYPVETTAPGAGSFAVRLDIQGLRGGHSGSDIHEHRANALQLLAHFLTRCKSQYPLQIARFEGGRMHNAIPREATAVVTVPMGKKEQIRIDWNIYQAELEEAWLTDEPGLNAQLNSCPPPEAVWSDRLADSVLKAVTTCPHGVLAWSRELEGIVETSCNLASLTREDDLLLLVSSQRSCVEDALDALAFQVYEQFAATGATPAITGRYTPWPPRFDNPLIHRTCDAYRRLFGSEVSVKVIHAGLECGLLQQKYPRMEMLSMGPTLRDVHSPSERLKVDSVDKVWRLLQELIQ